MTDKDQYHRNMHSTNGIAQESDEKTTYDNRFGTFSGAEMEGRLRVLNNTLI